MKRGKRSTQAWLHFKMSLRHISPFSFLEQWSFSSFSGKALVESPNTILDLQQAFKRRGSLFLVVNHALRNHEVSSDDVPSSTFKTFLCLKPMLVNNRGNHNVVVVERLNTRKLMRARKALENSALRYSDTTLGRWPWRWWTWPIDRQTHPRCLSDKENTLVLNTWSSAKPGAPSTFGA